jgi:hypothetical protein
VITKEEPRTLSAATVYALASFAVWSWLLGLGCEQRELGQAQTQRNGGDLSA